MLQSSSQPESQPTSNKVHNDSAEADRTWREHEHTASAVQAVASHLIEQAGSPALAKQAIDAAAADEAATKSQ